MSRFPTAPFGPRNEMVVYVGLPSEGRFKEECIAAAAGSGALGGVAGRRGSARAEIEGEWRIGWWGDGDGYEGSRVQGGWRVSGRGFICVWVDKTGADDMMHHPGGMG